MSKTIIFQTLIYQIQNQNNKGMTFKFIKSVKNKRLAPKSLSGGKFLEHLRNFGRNNYINPNTKVSLKDLRVSFIFSTPKIRIKYLN